MGRLRAMAKLLGSIAYRAGFVTHVLAGVLIVVMGLLVFQGVIRRYVFSNPEPYSYELTTYFLLACLLLSSVHVTSLQRHIKVDLFLSRFSERTKAVIINLLSPVIGLVFCGVVTWKSWVIALGSLQGGKESTLGVPLFAVQIVVPVATGLVCLVLLSQIADYLASVSFNGEKPESMV